MAGPKKTKKTQTVEITSQSSIQLSKDMVDMLTPALDSIRSSLKNQTRIWEWKILVKLPWLKAWVNPN